MLFIHIIISCTFRVDDKCEHFLKALQAVKHVKMKSQPGALMLAAMCQNKVLMYNRSEEEVSQMVDATLASAKLDIGDIHPHDARVLYSSKQYLGMLLFGNYKSTYSLNVSLAQVKEGARHTLHGIEYKCRKAALDACPVSSFEKYFLLECSMFPVAFHSICIVELPAFKGFKDACGELSVRARDIFEAYPQLVIYFEYLFFITKILTLRGAGMRVNGVMQGGYQGEGVTRLPSVTLLALHSPTPPICRSLMRYGPRMNRQLYLHQRAVTSN